MCSSHGELLVGSAKQHVPLEGRSINRSALGLGHWMPGHESRLCPLSSSEMARRFSNLSASFPHQKWGCNSIYLIEL